MYVTSAEAPAQTLLRSLVAFRHDPVTFHVPTMSPPQAGTLTQPASAPPAPPVGFRAPPPPPLPPRPPPPASVCPVTLPQETTRSAIPTSARSRRGCVMSQLSV